MAKKTTMIVESEPPMDILNVHQWENLVWDKTFNAKDTSSPILPQNLDLFE